MRIMKRLKNYFKSEKFKIWWCKHNHSKIKSEIDNKWYCTNKECAGVYDWLPEFTYPG